jgi:hypothetical protein
MVGPQDFGKRRQAAHFWRAGRYKQAPRKTQACRAAIGCVGVAVVVGVRATLFLLSGHAEDTSVWLELGIPASHGPDNKNSAALTRQIVSRPDFTHPTEERSRDALRLTKLSTS